MVVLFIMLVYKYQAKYCIDQLLMHTPASTPASAQPTPGPPTPAPAPPTPDPPTSASPTPAPPTPAPPTPSPPDPPPGHVLCFKCKMRNHHRRSTWCYFCNAKYS